MEDTEPTLSLLGAWNLSASPRKGQAAHLPEPVGAASHVFTTPTRNKQQAQVGPQGRQSRPCLWRCRLTGQPLKPPGAGPDGLQERAASAAGGRPAAGAQGQPRHGQPCGGAHAGAHGGAHRRRPPQRCAAQRRSPGAEVLPALSRCAWGACIESHQGTPSGLQHSWVQPGRQVFGPSLHPPPLAAEGCQGPLLLLQGLQHPHAEPAGGQPAQGGGRGAPPEGATGGRGQQSRQAERSGSAGSARTQPQLPVACCPQGTAPAAPGQHTGLACRRCCSMGSAPGGWSGCACAPRGMLPTTLLRACIVRADGLGAARAGRPAQARARGGGGAQRGAAQRSAGRCQSGWRRVSCQHEGACLAASLDPAPYTCNPPARSPAGDPGCTLQCQPGCAACCPWASSGGRAMQVRSIVCAASR